MNTFPLQASSQSGPEGLGARPSNHEEIEIKFRTTNQELAAIASSPLFALASFQDVSIKSTYFDTAGWDLRESGITLRVREVGGQPCFLSLKAAGNTFSRAEIEVRTSSRTPDITLFSRKVSETLAQLIRRQPLLPLIETKIERRKAHIQKGSSEIEIALDEGNIKAADRQIVLTELELELLSGDQLDLYGLAIEIAAQFSVSLDFTSKSERGFYLCTESEPKPSNAPALKLRKKATVEDAMLAVCGNALAHFTGNWHSLRETDHPEAVHQMRVALRRLRSAHKIFRKALQSSEFDSIRNEARLLASALGFARECDALHDELLQGPLAESGYPEGRQKLLALVEEHRVNAYKSARKTVDSRQASLFVLNLHQFLVRRPWRHDSPDALEIYASKFASKTLRRLFTQTLKYGNRLPRISEEHLHSLRIALKNMRYAAEFFGGVFARKRTVRQFLKRAEALQEILGLQNDIVVTRHFLVELAGSSASEVQTACSFVLGWDACHAASMQIDLLKHWKKFVRTKPFWN